MNVDPRDAMTDVEEEAKDNSNNNKPQLVARMTDGPKSDVKNKDFVLVITHSNGFPFSIL